MFPAWDSLNIFLSFPSDARIHGRVHLLKPQKEMELVPVQQARGLAEAGLRTAGAGLGHPARAWPGTATKRARNKWSGWEVVVQANHRARAWAASVHNAHVPREWPCWGLGSGSASCLSPASLYLSLWHHSPRALTWADVAYLSFWPLLSPSS